ncbi:DUF721 domain-containing protein [Leptolyngbya ohadii]|uniref:DUF721 domain-containing protein n=1 Tax=Leptolyngbya ohadii TaxID=1962290 RepID=UPI000B59A778|nr:DciA family protein [Leptolyngbya ohadii]
MSSYRFNSLNHVLGAIEHQERWQGRRQFQQLLACWTEVVGMAVAAQTRPTEIQRKVLHVATSSPAWAQNLAFERHRILEKLNDRFALGLKDIRFSAAQWQTTDRLFTTDSLSLWQSHPSRLSDATPFTSAAADDPQSAFRNWARQMRSRSQHLPLCPVCHCPTPEGELSRWSACALCAAKQFR